MAINLPLPQNWLNRTASLQVQIDGSPFFRVLSEFLRNSALYPMLQAIRKVTDTGWEAYLSNPVHYVLFLAMLIQAYVVGTMQSQRWYAKFGGHMLGFSLYTLFELLVDGPISFIQNPYHWLFGGVSFCIASLITLQTLTTDSFFWQMTTNIMINMVKISLISGMYMLLELDIEMNSDLTWASWLTYMEAHGHQFILYGTLFFGLLLGLTEWQRANYAASLRAIATQLKQYSEWSLSADLVADAVNDPTALQLHRAERTILFMDIRGFTAWTEQVNPQQAAEMLNHYYQQAEIIITKYHGHKPNFTADEVMTRFSDPEAAMQTANALQHALKPHLAAYNLAVGIGLHTGEVIEGLMGSANTRKYDLIGDAVNTAKRLESAAGAGEIVLSAVTYHALKIPPTTVELRELRVKGKSEPLQVFAISQ